MRSWFVCAMLVITSVVSAQEAPEDATPNVFEVGDTFTAPSGLTTVELFINTVSAVETPAALSVLTIGPGATVPEHMHEGSVELLYIVEGGGTMTVAGIAQAVTAGSAVYIPADTLHAYTNDANQTTRAVQVYVGPGPEARFRSWAPVEE